MALGWPSPAAMFAIGVTAIARGRGPVEDDGMKDAVCPIHQVRWAFQQRSSMRAFQPRLQDVESVVGDQRSEQRSGVSKVATVQLAPRA